MELFAHGQDIADTVGVQREHTDGIGHLTWFGTRNRDFGYLVRGLTPPDAQFRYELTGSVRDHLGVRPGRRAEPDNGSGGGLLHARHAPQEPRRSRHRGNRPRS